MMGNGLFALHLRSIFLNNQAIIKYHGMESPIERPEARYDFDMSRMLSGYTVHHAGAAGRVATYGSFWADPKTYDLRRLEFHAVDIPPELRLQLMRNSFTCIYNNNYKICRRHCFGSF